MTQEVASNTVKIYAAHGRSTACLSSGLTHDAQDADLWIIDVHWSSCKAMSEHFAKPSNEGLNGLLNNCFVRRVAFDSDTERCDLPGAI
ncbi:hypothetical protein [Pseudomonas sp. Pseu.R1]|uniref:hypothetical protein n=1 Tax=Pseudomonas sp. Pseu.R1 TaxID=3379818 RepID=UPI003B960426